MQLKTSMSMYGMVQAVANWLNRIPVISEIICYQQSKYLCVPPFAGKLNADVCISTSSRSWTSIFLVCTCGVQMTHAFSYMCLVHCIVVFSNCVLVLFRS